MLRDLYKRHPKGEKEIHLLKTLALFYRARMPRTVRVLHMNQIYIEHRDNDWFANTRILDDIDIALRDTGFKRDLNKLSDAKKLMLSARIIATILHNFHNDAQLQRNKKKRHAFIVGPSIKYRNLCSTDSTLKNIDDELYALIQKLLTPLTFSVNKDLLIQNLLQTISLAKTLNIPVTSIPIVGFNNYRKHTDALMKQCQSEIKSIQCAIQHYKEKSNKACLTLFDNTNKIKRNIESLEHALHSYKDMALQLKLMHTATSGKAALFDDACYDKYLRHMSFTSTATMSHR